MQFAAVWAGHGRMQAGVLEQLREDIVALTLAPGCVLSRLELQARFGVSSTPIRDALMRLQEEGLVDIFPQHATMVSRIDIAKAREAQFLRRSIELELVRDLALKPDAVFIARLRSLIRQQKAFAGVEEYHAFNAMDQAFHFAMYEAGQVADLWQLMRRRSGHIDRLRRLHLPIKGKVREILRAHNDIVDAIESGQPHQAQTALRDHLSRSLEFAGRLREQYPDYFKV
ncbi:MAG: GntR family transcriptional regulator [Beijerinckiaceae bacterium]